KQVRFVLTIREETAKASYPELYAFLKNLGPLAQGRIDVEDESRRTLFTVRFSTKDLRVELDTFTADGKVLPLEDGPVAATKPVDLEAALASKHRICMNLSFDVNGITTELRGLTIKVAYERRVEVPAPGKPATDMTLKYCFDEMPTVAVSGSAYGFLPTWAID